MPRIPAFSTVPIDTSYTDPANMGVQALDLSRYGFANVTPANRRTPFNMIMGQAGKIAPYASNIANSFRKVPRIPVPRTMASVTAPRVNYDAARAEIGRQQTAANAGADRGLDENTAAAVKAGIYGQSISARNNVAQQEGNTNAMMQGQTNQLNASIDANNAGQLNEWQREQVGAQIAGQRASSENISNAADKYMMQQNQQNAAQLDREKMDILSTMWKDSGVYERLIAGLKKNGMTDPMGQDYMKKAYGGPVRPIVGAPMPAYNFDPRDTRPTATDSMLYNDNFNSMLHNSPLAQQRYNNMNNYGYQVWRQGPEFKPLGDQIDYNNTMNAFKDAFSYKGNTRMRAFGGPVGPDIPANAQKGPDFVNSPGRSDLRMNEMASYLINNGKSNPMNDINGKPLFDQLNENYGLQAAHGMINEISLFNQDPSNKALSPDERINRFYKSTTNAQWKDHLNRFGTGPTDVYHTANLLDARQQQNSYTKRKMGGRVKAFA